MIDTAGCFQCELCGLLAIMWALMFLAFLLFKKISCIMHYCCTTFAYQLICSRTICSESIKIIIIPQKGSGTWCMQLDDICYDEFTHAGLRAYYTVMFHYNITEYQSNWVQQLACTKWNREFVPAEEYPSLCSKGRYTKLREWC